MKTKLLLLLWFISFGAFAQIEDAWVFFNDKPNSQSFFDNPLAELSQRSLDRRTTQEIALDIKDAPLHQPYIDQVAASTGITILAKTKWLNALHIRGTQSDIAALTTLPFINHIQYANHSLNPTARLALKTKKNTRVNKWQQFQVDYTYGSSATQVQMLNAHILHQNDYTGSGKIIAVLDAGFLGVNTAAPFQYLRDNGKILGGYDFVNNSTDFYTGNSHGTLVLSTMGGFATNLVGTAPNAHYYLFITEDVNSETPLEETNWIEAAEEADRLGVDVINTSLGYFDYDNDAYSYSYAHMNGAVSVMSRAVDIAFSRGMICVTSAGNSGSTSDPYISAPADAALNVTVGSVTSGEIKSGFSSVGPSSDGRIKPDLMAMGTSSVLSNTSGSIVTGNGTSFSSPIIAGAITSLWSAFPNKKNSEIMQLVKQSADKYNNPNNNYGYGIPNFQLALNSQMFEEEFLMLYPNPSSDYITVSIPKKIMGSEIVFYNNLGQVVLKNTITDKVQNISLHELSNGIYYYNLASLKGKIIKN